MAHNQQEATPIAAADAEAGSAVQEDTAPTDLSDEPTGRQRAFSFARELAETILLTLVIFLAVRALVVNYRVDGESMHPSLANGQYLLVNKAIYFHFDRSILPGAAANDHHPVYLFHPPQRGDIIVFNPPSMSDKPYVKRVIGLPGDHIRVHNNQVFVNGTAISEPYIASPPSYTYPLNGSDYVVPENSLFVLGDNRNNSSDSHHFGAVAFDSVIGKATLSYWPSSRFGVIPHEQYSIPEGGN